MIKTDFDSGPIRNSCLFQC